MTGGGLLPPYPHSACFAFPVLPLDLTVEPALCPKAETFSKEPPCPPLCCVISLGASQRLIPRVAHRLNVGGAQNSSLRVLFRPPVGPSWRPSFLSSAAQSWETCFPLQCSLELFSEHLGKHALLREDPWQQKSCVFALLLHVKAP